MRTSWTGNWPNYLAKENLQSANEIEPDAFAKWIFPELLEYRRPLYETLANKHGYTVDASLISDINSESDFIDLIADSIDRNQ